MNATTPRDRVTRGAAFLDRVVPGWFHRVDFRRFDMAEPCQCVLGHVCGDFFSGMEQLNVPDAVGYGFDAVGEPERYADTVSLDFAALQAEWVIAIRARRAVDRLVRGELPDTAKQADAAPSGAVGGTHPSNQSLNRQGA